MLPRKVERNKELLEKRNKGWSYQKLADFYGLNVKTAYEIVNGYYKKKLSTGLSPKALDSIGE